MLHNRRKRLGELAAKEAAGHSFWTEHFDEAARRKIVLIASDIVGRGFQAHQFLSLARKLILHDEGLFYLSGQYKGDEEDMLTFVMEADHSMMPTVVEALSNAFNDNRLRHATGVHDAGVAFDAALAIILREHRISYDLIDSEMVGFSSRAMHVGVVSPALRLLAGESKWDRTEKAYRDAIGEISDGKPEDAITDAGTALQEALTILGCEGNALGPLIKSARAKDVFAAHDGPMLDAIDRVMSWVSADRSQKGDAHSSSPASLDDAWLIVHVVGALLLRISKNHRSP